VLWGEAAMALVRSDLSKTYTLGERLVRLATRVELVEQDQELAHVGFECDCARKSLSNSVMQCRGHIFGQPELVDLVSPELP
jgi:hypothetical protein